MSNLQTIITKIEAFASPQLASFDHVGLLQGDMTKKIHRVGITLDYSMNAIQKAISDDCDLLITHHGPTKINYPIVGNNAEKLFAAHAADMAVYRAHLSLDFCDGGVIDTLCELLNIPAKKVNLIYEGQLVRGANIASNYPISLDEIVRRTKVLGHPYVRVAGAYRTEFRRVAVTSGKGFISEFYDQLKPDLFIAGEFEQEATKYAEDLGITLLELSHHASESKPLELIADKLEHALGIPVTHIEVADSIRVLNSGDVRYNEL